MVDRKKDGTFGLFLGTWNIFTVHPFSVYGILLVVQVFYMYNTCMTSIIHVKYM